MIRPVVVGPINRPTAHEQFDMVYRVLWTFPGPLQHSNSLIFKAEVIVLTIFVSESFDAKARPRGHCHLKARPPGMFCCAKALGLGTHFGAKAPGYPGGDGNQSN